MGISSEYFGTVAFLSDLNIQCRLFKRSYERLTIAADHWINISEGVNDGTKFSPLDVIAECTVCLSVMSAIKRVLNSDKPTSSKKRSLMLMGILGDPQLTNIFTKKVRNSWEHHDERLDKLLKNFGEGDRLCDIHVSVPPPHERSLTLKRFAPASLSIHFLNDAIELTPCFEEIELLTERINEALTNLANGA